MKIEEKIKLDIRKSMIGKNTKRTILLRTVLGEFNRISKHIANEKALSIMKKMKENAIQLNDVFEIEVLSEYLPEVLSEKETIEIVKNLVKGNSYTIKDMGNIMKKLKVKYSSTMDMKIASITVKQLL